MERGSDKHGSRVDDAMSGENEPVERSAKETRAEEGRESERVGREDADEDTRSERGTAPDPHLAGSQSSADVYPHQELEEGGESHPKPRERTQDESDDAAVDEASEESFPASDPPAW